MLVQTMRGQLADVECTGPVSFIDESVRVRVMCRTQPKLFCYFVHLRNERLYGISCLAVLKGIRVRFELFPSFFILKVKYSSIEFLILQANKKIIRIHFYLNQSNKRIINIYLLQLKRMQHHFLKGASNHEVDPIQIMFHLFSNMRLFLEITNLKRLILKNIIIPDFNIPIIDAAALETLTLSD